MRCRVWSADWLPIPAFPTRPAAGLQTHVITAHVAVGSLLLATSVATALMAARLLRPAAAIVPTAAAGRMGVADMTRITTNAASHSTGWTSARSGWLLRVGDFVELTKPRIVMLELVTVVVAAHLAAPRGVDAWVLCHAVAGAALVAASAGAFNQWLEAATDARMLRTAGRPLPAGRLAAWQVVLFGLVTLAAGASELLWFVNPLATGAAIATWLIYVVLYTPLKTRTPLNTAVGAVSGALPILIGWTATGAAVDMRAWALVAVMFLWQFPHFMAIAWLYREDYAARQASEC